MLRVLLLDFGLCLLRFVFVIVWVGITPLVSVGQTIVERADIIDRQYDELIKDSKGVAKAQIAAGRIRKSRYRAIVDDVEKAKLEIDSLAEQVALAKAAEFAELPEKVAEYSKEVLRLDPTCTEGYVLLLRQSFNERKFDEAEAILNQGLAKAGEKARFSPYLGVLAFAKTQVGQADSAITHFEKYLESRYPTTKKSLQVFSILPAVAKDVSINCLNLSDRKRLDLFLDQCLKKIESIHKSERLETKETLSEFQIIWNLRYYMAGIYIAGCRGDGAKVVQYYENLIRFTHKHQNLVGNSQSVMDLLLEAARYAEGASCQWSSESLPDIFASLDRLERLVNEDETADQSTVVNLQLLKSISLVHGHVAELLKATENLKTGGLVPANRQPEVTLWFGNDLSVLQNTRSSLRPFQGMGANVLNIGFSDDSIAEQVEEWIAIQKKGRKQQGSCQLRALKIEKERIKGLDKISAPAWIACDEGEIQQVLIGNQTPKLLWVYWFLLDTNKGGYKP